jgi:hypothetical protein
MGVISMTDRRINHLILATALFVGAGPSSAGGEGLDLVNWMGRMQYFTHKLGLAIDAGNAPLVGYYLHEVEEVIEEIESIDAYDEVPIGSLTKEILVPAFEALEQDFDRGDRAALDRGYDALIGACNQCHQRAQRFYLVIERRRENPYAQRFDAKPSDGSAVLP